MPDAPPADALALDGIVKRFGATRALDGASLAVRAGTLHAVLGENGAGKTTLLRVAFGMVAPDAGTVRVHGAPRRFASPADAIAAGVGMVHQHFSLVPAMTVAENVALGGRGRYDARGAAERVRTLAAATGLALDPAARVADLGVAAQQRLEIVKALARDARLLILDEPGAVLSPRESDELLAWLRRHVDAGATAVLITHKLRDALRWADAVTVLRRGRTVHAAPAATESEASLVAAMLGDGALAAELTATPAAPADAPPADATPADATPADATLDEDVGPTSRRTPSDGAAAAATAATVGASAATRPHAEVPTGPIVVRADGVGFTDERGVVRLREARFTLHAGELVGVAAVEGSGQHELLRLLAGRLAPTNGALDRPDRVAFVPADRHRDALLLEGTLTENLALRGAGARRGRMPWRDLRERAAALVAAADVRGGTPGAVARGLSGGNQQKFVVARELEADASGAVPPLVVAENPTRGLDVRATAAVHARLRAARDAGAAVVVHSSDLDEVLALADRVLAVHDGRVLAVAAERDAVGRAMLGG